MGKENIDKTPPKGEIKFSITLSDEQKKDLGIKYGVQISNLIDGKLKQGGIREDYIITKINRTPIKTIDDIKRIIGISSGGVLIEGIYPNGLVAYYAIGI